MDDEIFRRSIEELISTPLSDLSKGDLNMKCLDHARVFNADNIPSALRDSQEYAKNGGIVLSMPDFIQAILHLDDDHFLWKQSWISTLSEEHIGIDEDGIFVEKGKAVLVVVHGGGILTPERIEMAKDDGLINSSSAKLNHSEFYNLLKGHVASGNKIPLYNFNEFLEVCSLPRNHGIVVDFEDVRNDNGGHLLKGEFMTDKGIIARVGSLEYLEDFFEKAKNRSNMVANWPNYRKIDPYWSTDHIPEVALDYLRPLLGESLDPFQPQGSLLNYFYKPGGDGAQIGSDWLYQLGTFVALSAKDIIK